MGFMKNGCGMKMLKTWWSKEILIEMDEGELRSLEKCFFSEKEWWNEEEKSRGRRRWMVPMEEEKLMEDEVKKQKERNNEVGGKNFRPHTP